MAALRRLSPLVINSTKVQFAHRTTSVAFNTSFKLGASFSSSSPAAMSSAKELVDSTIAQNDVVVFSKSYCPYCKTAKQIISSETSDATILELDQRDDGSEIQAYLKQLNGQGTVPHVYIRQKFIGGCSDLQKVAKPQLKKLISGA